MSTTTPGHTKIIAAQADNPLAGALVVLYGVGGIGKTTVACQAPGPVLALDCADGAAGKGADRWPITTVADFREAVTWLKQPGHGYTSIVLDGYDFLYARTAQAIPVSNDRRGQHLKVQDQLHPVLYDFLTLPELKVLVLNERKKIDDTTKRKLVLLDLAQRAAELVDNAAHVLARCELKDGAKETTLRVRRVDNAATYVPAKSRYDTIKDGDRLASLWTKLTDSEAQHRAAVDDAFRHAFEQIDAGTEDDASIPKAAATGELPVSVVVPANAAEAVRYLNHALGVPFYRTPTHLGNVLKKHGNGQPADGDRRGWEHALAVATDYAAGQIGAAAAATTVVDQQPHVEAAQ